MDQSIVGKLLFGRPARLAVAVWVRGQAEPFFQTQAATEVRLPSSNVTEELGRLISLGMVQQFPRASGDRRQWYSRVDSPLWRIVETAEQALREVATG